MIQTGWSSATYDHNGRLLKATYDPTRFCLLAHRAACPRCTASPGWPCVTPRGWGTRTHAAREAASRRLRDAA